MKKKLLALALSFTLTLSLFPATAVADTSAENPFLITTGLDFSDISNTPIAAQDCTNTGDSGKNSLMDTASDTAVVHDHAPDDGTSTGTPCWSWVPAAVDTPAQLTINNIDIKAPTTKDGIILPNGTPTMIVNGNNTIIGGNDTAGGAKDGITTQEKLTIQSESDAPSSTLTVTGGNASGTAGNLTGGFGIEAHSLTIDGVTVTATGGDTGGRGITVSDTLTIKNAEVTTTGGSGKGGGNGNGLAVSKIAMKRGWINAKTGTGAAVVSRVSTLTANEFNNVVIKQKDAATGAYTVPTFFNMDANKKYISLTSATTATPATDVMITAIPNVTAARLGSGGEAAGYYEADEAVSIKAGTNSGHTFSGWTFTHSEGSAISNPTFTAGTASDAIATFTMPNPVVEITVTANWTENPPTPTPDPTPPPSGSSDDNDSPPSSGATVTVTTPSGDASAPVQLELKLPTKADGKGGTVADISESALKEAIAKAEAAAKAAGLDGNGIALKFTPEGAAAGSSASGLKLSAAALKALDGKNIASLTCDFGSGKGSMTLDKTALQTVTREATGTVTISSTKVDTAKLPVVAAAAVGNRPALDFTISHSGGNISDLGGGAVQLTIPYTPPALENTANLRMVYLPFVGGVMKKPVLLNVARYLERLGSVTVSSPHLSIYAVSYQHSADMMDVENHWAANEIEFMVSKGLLNGTSATAFAPDDTMTRSMLWTVLYRQAGSPAVTAVEDVWYGAAQQWAQSTKLSDGSSPGGSVTREQLATILWRNAGSPQSSSSLQQFGDALAVTGYAQAAMIWAVESGIIGGTSDGRIDPQGLATRAQVAIMLTRAITD